MIIHNPILTGSFTVNGTDVASITSSAASITALNSYTASQNILNGTYTLTSSFAAQTASFTAFTSSVNSFTASQLVLNGTYATTGSNTFAGIQTVNSNLIVTGSITAQTLVVQTITSSVDFVTGSTRFGSLSANTHVFTGSILISSGSNVGVGTSSPGAILHTLKSGTAIAGIGDEVFIGQRSNSTNNAAVTIVSNNESVIRFTNTASVELGAVTYDTVNNFMLFKTNSTERMRISGSNVGIGTISPVQPLQLGDVSVISQDTNSMYIGANFGNSTGGNYIKSQFANQIHFDSAVGAINFKVAGSGTAGNAITYTNALTIASTGAATFSGNVTAGGFGAFTAAANGSPVLTLGTAGAINAVINTADEMFFNIDSDNSQTGASFIFGTNRTGTSGGSELVRFQDNGSVGITAADTPQLLLTHSNTSRTFLMAVDGSNAFFRANSTNNILFQIAGGTTALTITTGGSVQYSVPYSSGYHMDTTPSQIAVANGGTINFSLFSGMIVINNHTSGGVTIWLVGAGSTTAVASNGTQVGTMAYNAGIAGYTWTNNSGGTNIFGAAIIRTRTTA